MAQADALTQGLSMPVVRSTIKIGGTTALVLEGMPGAGANERILLAHDGALYEVTAFGTGQNLDPDQQSALATLQFVRRYGAFPSGNPSTQLPPALVQQLLRDGAIRRAMLSHLQTVGVQPTSLPGGQSIYPFWTSNAQGCGSQGPGNLGVATCGSFFINQNDHKNYPNGPQDADAVDWPINTGSAVYGQTLGTNSGTVMYAGMDTDGWSAYGIMVVVSYPYGLVALYGHLSGTNVGVGQGVDDATVLGASGCTGHCGNLPHVHLAMYSGGVQFSQGRPYNGQAQLQWPLTNFTGKVYNPLYQGEIVHATGS